MRIGMGCKAQTTDIALAMARICNAADRPRPRLHTREEIVNTFLAGAAPRHGIQRALVVRANAAHLGYGLGLSIVGSIARQHGASFSLTSPVPGRSSGLQAMLVFAATDQADRTDQAD